LDRDLLDIVSTPYWTAASVWIDHWLSTAALKQTKSSNCIFQLHWRQSTNQSVS